MTGGWLLYLRLLCYPHPPFPSPSKNLNGFVNNLKITKILLIQMSNSFSILELLPQRKCDKRKSHYSSDCINIECCNIKLFILSLFTENYFLFKQISLRTHSLLFRIRDWSSVLSLKRSTPSACVQWTDRTRIKQTLYSLVTCFSLFCLIFHVIDCRVPSPMQISFKFTVSQFPQKNVLHYTKTGCFRTLCVEQTSRQ